jgi:hypothetical protein
MNNLDFYRRCRLQKQPAVSKEGYRNIAGKVGVDSNEVLHSMVIFVVKKKNG